MAHKNTQSHLRRLGALSGFIAAASMAATPAYAAEIAAPSPAQQSVGYGSLNISGITASDVLESARAVEGDEVSQWHGYRYRPYRRYRHRNRGVSAGDVLTGVLVLGGIAAIASAATSNNRRDRDRRYDRRYDNRRYDSRRYDDRRYDNRRRYDDRSSSRRSTSSNGLDSAVNQCMREIERDVRVDTVDNASRIAQGWLVTGTLFNGSGFTCEIGNDGRISNIDYRGFGSGSASATGADDGGQWSDDRYANARAAAGPQAYEGPVRVDPNSAALPDQARAEPQPAYPGGPLPGEE